MGEIVVHIYGETEGQIDLTAAECLQMELKLNLSPKNRDGKFNVLGDQLYQAHRDKRLRLHYADAAMFGHVADLVTRSLDDWKREWA